MTRPIDRRTFLRASGVALGLPLLESMHPALARAASSCTSVASHASGGSSGGSMIDRSKGGAPQKAMDKADCRARVVERSVSLLCNLTYTAASWDRYLGQSASPFVRGI